jgi:carbon monoxide dehydrogenase subunit G
MLKGILIALGVIVVVLVIVVALRPAEYRVVRSATVSAPAAVVFEQVNDLHKFQAWSPWAKLDPASQNTFEGPPAGTGAAFTWAGNSKVGEGRMTVIESRPNEGIRMRLDFLKPFAGTSTVDFSFRPVGDHTEVTWSMVGRHNFLVKAIGLFMSMDKMVGSMFEHGLTSLDSVAQAATKKQ